MRGKKRPPVPSEFSAERDGQLAEFSKYTSKVNTQVNGILVERFDFAVCPICLDPRPDREEHVPPLSIGGKVMTMTCQSCNNDFGTAEEQLRSLIDLETTVHVEATDSSVPGRRAAKVAFRSSPGRPNEFFVRSSAPGFEEIWASGSGSWTPKPLDMALVAAAALKHSYLAACLHNRAIPVTGEADLVRTILVAARDRDRGALVAGLNELGSGLPMGWIESPPECPPVLLRDFERDGTTMWEFLLGGRIRLLWPLRTVLPLAASRPRPRGGSVEA